MMVRKAAGGHHPCADLGEVLEEFLRPADAGEDDERLAGEVRLRRPRLGVQHRRRVQQRCGASLVVSEHHHRIGARETMRDGLAQWSGGYDAPIAEAVTAVER